VRAILESQCEPKVVVFKQKLFNRFRPQQLRQIRDRLPGSKVAGQTVRDQDRASAGDLHITEPAILDAMGAREV